jgi:hypothetical protein
MYLKNDFLTDDGEEKLLGRIDVIKNSINHSMRVDNNNNSNDNKILQGYYDCYEF